jgi:hypothetical protein
MHADKCTPTIMNNTQHDRFAELMTPRIKLELVEDKLCEIRKMIADIADELYFEEFHG